MNKSIIEDKGINAVSDYLSDIGYIKPFLSKNDKTPMWDGDIFVYKTKENFDNEWFDYRVPAQVKASEYRGEVFPDKTSFSIKLGALKNYLNDGGLAFFKVLIKGKERQIYCSFLTKATIERILNSSKKTNQSKSIQLLKIPEDGRIVLKQLKRISLLRNHPLLDLSSLNQRSDFKFSFQIDHVSKNTNIFEYIATHDVDLLISLDNIPGEFYAKGGPMRIQSKTTLHESVTIKGKEFFNCYEHAYKDDGEHLYIGCVELIAPYKDKEKQLATIHILPKANTLKGIIDELDFILTLSRYKEFDLGEKHFDLSTLDFSSAPIKNWTEDIKYWRDIVKLCGLINLKPNFNPCQLSENDHKNLHLLIQAILYKNEVYGDSKTGQLLLLNVADQKVLVFAAPIKNNAYKLYEIHEFHSTDYIDEQGERRSTTIYSLIFEQEELPSNLQLAKIVNSYKAFKKSNSLISLRANQDLLNILNHYDRCHDRSLLIAALDIAKWLKNEKNSAIKNRNILFLNYMQVLLRKNGEFSFEEKLKLYKMRATNNIDNFARFLLLGDKLRAKSFLKKMSKSEIENIKTLPIYHFM